MANDRKLEVRMTTRLLEAIDGARSEGETRSEWVRRAIVVWLEEQGVSVGRMGPQRRRRPRAQADVESAPAPNTADVAEAAALDRVAVGKVGPDERGDEGAGIAHSPEEHEAYLARRARQLYGQGMTRKIAARVAQKEWEDGKR